MLKLIKIGAFDHQAKEVKLIDRMSIVKSARLSG